MTLSDPAGPGFPEPGSSRPRRRRARKTILATALAVTAATGVLGVTAVSSAQAATLGEVQVKSSPGLRGQGGAADQQRSTAWNLLWRDAYNTCRQKYPNTKSVEMTDVSFYGSRPPYEVRAYWNCRDTQ